MKAVLAKHCLRPPVLDLWGPAGSRSLYNVALDRGYVTKIGSLRDLVDLHDREIDQLEREICRWLADGVSYWAIQHIRGIGPTLAATFVAEIGDVTRLCNAGALCSWAGLTPKHRESDANVHRGRITKQGSSLLRWAAIEAVSKTRAASVDSDYHRVAARRGNSIARVAAARKPVTLLYYGPRDGEIPCLEHTREVA